MPYFGHKFQFRTLGTSIMILTSHGSVCSLTWISLPPFRVYLPSSTVLSTKLPISFALDSSSPFMPNEVRDPLKKKKQLSGWWHLFLPYSPEARGSWMSSMFLIVSSKSLSVPFFCQNSQFVWNKSLWCPLHFLNTRPQNSLMSYHSLEVLLIHSWCLLFF